LVLTKSDLVEAEALAGWKVWVKDWWAQGCKDRGPDVQVVSVQSYLDEAEYEGKSLALTIWTALTASVIEADTESS
jgi:hypothetical protein